MNTKKEFTISVFTENHSGMLLRVVSVFTRRHINIESLTTSSSSIDDIHLFTIVVHTEERMVRKLVAQLDKEVEVTKAFYYTNQQIVHQEMALYKVPTSIFSDSDRVEELVRHYNARILSIEPAYTVIEKTGHEGEIEALLAELKEIGIYEFVRSGRVAIKKPLEQLKTHLQQIEIKSMNNRIAL